MSSDFRSAVTAADPRLSAEDGLLNLLLDDFPVATLVSIMSARSKKSVSVAPGMRHVTVTPLSFNSARSA